MIYLTNIIDKSWALFLDRDGVINRRRVDDYVKSWEEFEFLPGVLEGLKIFNSIFGKIIVVTNQQGVEKGLMTEYQLQSIHEKMVREIEKAGGRIDSVFYCTELKEKKDNCRKPGIKMFEQARNKFPDISASKSIMAGDSESDIIFGRNAGMMTVSIGENIDLADFYFDSLKHFADKLKY